jgi:hypothetical protein
LLVALVSCSREPDFINSANLNAIGASYVKLCFALGRYDKDFVDGYFGPDSLKKISLKDTLSLEKIKEYSQILSKSIDSKFSEDKIRANHLKSLLLSLTARTDYVSGKKMNFDKESLLIYNCVSPIYSPEYYKNIMLDLEALIPGNGNLTKRWLSFRQQFVIPEKKLDTLFKLAINECKRRTSKHFKLPENDAFKIEFVKGQPWGAYNWYKGNAVSLIQINTDVPITIEKILGYACHEGYPGHHLYHSISDREFYRKKGWVEFSIIPLFSPKAVISEGLANYGIEVCFSQTEKLQFEKNVICKIAGIDPSNLDKYNQILELRRKLRFIGSTIAKRYLDGNLKKNFALDWIKYYEFRSDKEAENSISFIEKYRSYIITYSVGYELAKEYFAANHANDAESKWKLYHQLLYNPTLPYDIEVKK